MTSQTEESRLTSMATTIAQKRGRRSAPTPSANFMPLMAEAMSRMRRLPAQLKVMAKLKMPDGVTEPVPRKLMTMVWDVIWGRMKPKPLSAMRRAMNRKTPNATSRKTMVTHSGTPDKVSQTVT